MIIRVFFQSELVAYGVIDNSGTQYARGCLIDARERLRTGSKHMATYQAVVQTQSRCLIAAKERPRAGRK